MKKLAFKIGSLVIVFALLYYVLNKIGFSELYNNLKQADAVYILIAFGVTTLSFIVWNLRWYNIIIEIKRVGFWKIFPIFLSGVFINTVTPGARVGGEPIRAHFLAKKYKMSRSRAFATTIADKIYNFIIFGMLVILSVIFVVLYVKIGLALKIVLESLLAFVILVLIAIFLFHQKFHVKKQCKLKILLPIVYKAPFLKIKNKFKTYAAFQAYGLKRLHRFLTTLKNSLSDRRKASKNLTLVSLFWLCLFLSMYFIFKGLGSDIGFIPVMIVVTLSVLLGDVAITPGGIGIIEAVMIALYYAFGITPAMAAAATVLNRVMYYFYALGLGAVSFCYLTLKKKW